MDNQTVLEGLLGLLQPLLPIRVRVRHDRYIDAGREGDLTSVSYEDGTIRAFVDNMTPGDDGSPARYHQLESLIWIDPPVPT